MARVYTSEHDTRVERVLYRVVGVDPEADQRWPVYARALLAFSAVSVLGLYALQRFQPHLPLSLGFPGVAPDQAFNTAASFVTNTNWQSYSGESTMGHLVQMAGLAVQNFASAAVGMAVAVALIRGFARSRTDRVGNFWVDLVRGMPAHPAAARGRRRPSSWSRSGRCRTSPPAPTVTTLAGQSQTITGGPVASQEAIKELGTNGGGFYNANSAHPFENPNALSNILEIFLLLLIPVCLTYTFGRMVKDKRQGYAILGAMACSLGADRGRHLGAGGRPPRHGAAARRRVDGGQGDPFRSGRLLAVRGLDDRHVHRRGRLLPLLVHRPRRRRWPIFNMGLGEVAPGGVGSGLYGMLVLAIVTVFVAGLMVGRTPEYLRKKITGREIKLVSLYILTMPVARAGRDGPGDGPARPEAVDPQPGPARPVRGALRLHVRRQQQRLRVRRAVGQHRLLQHRARAGDARRPVPPHRARARPGRVAGAPSSRSPRPPAPCPPTARCSSGCSSASSSSSPA